MKTSNYPLTSRDPSYFWDRDLHDPKKYVLWQTVAGPSTKPRQVQAIWQSGRRWAALTGEDFATFGEAKRAMELWEIERLRTEAEELASRATACMPAPVFHRAGADTWTGIVSNARSSYYDAETNSTSYSLDGQVIGLRGYRPGPALQGGGIADCWAIQNGPSTEADGFAAGPLAHAATLAALHAHYGA